jgi:hypothetical protein
MNEDILLHWIERGIFVFIARIEWTEDMKRESRIFALVQIREFDK